MVGSMQVFDALLRQLAIGDDQCCIVPCAESRGPPIYVDDLALCAVIKFNPITKPKRVLYAKGNAGKQIT